MMQVRFKTVALWSLVKHSTTEPLRSPVFLRKDHIMENVLKFQTLLACQNGLDKQYKPRSVLLKKQFDQGIPCSVLLFFAVLTSKDLGQS